MQVDTSLVIVVSEISKELENTYYQFHVAQVYTT